MQTHTYNILVFLENPGVNILTCNAGTIKFTRWGGEKFIFMS